MLPVRPWLLLGLPLLGLATQVPFIQNPPSNQVSERMAEMKWRPDANFEFKTGDDVFSPKDLVELSRPGGGIANDVGDVMLVPMSKFSFKDKECV